MGSALWDEGDDKYCHMTDAEGLLVRDRGSIT
jgi:hypothetical protein